MFWQLSEIYCIYIFVFQLRFILGDENVLMVLILVNYINQDIWRNLGMHNIWYSYQSKLDI